MTKERESNGSESVSHLLLTMQKLDSKKSVNAPVTETEDVNDMCEELAAEKEKNQCLLADLKMSMTLVKDASAMNLADKSYDPSAIDATK